MEEKFDPEGSGYDDKTGNELIEKWPLTTPKPDKYEGEVVRNKKGESFQSWVWHPELNDYRKHSGSLDPRTGMLLKGRKHKTIHLTDKEEKRLGNIFIKKGGRYYSIKGTGIPK